MASRIFTLLPLALLALLLTAGCGSKKKSDSTSDFGPGQRDGGTGFVLCGTPNEGCACENEGQQVGCGYVKRRSGDYVSCSKGVRTCESGHWGECVGDAIVEMEMAPSQRNLLQLSGSAPCVDNPCDPYCNSADDDPNDVPKDAGFTLVDGGLVINPETLTIGQQPVCTGITVSPQTATITVTNVNTSGGGYTITPPALDLTANEVPTGCISPLNAVWSLDRLDLATISDTGTVTLAAPIAATMTATAYAGTYSQPVNITVNVDTFDTSQVPPANVMAITTLYQSTPSGVDPMKVLYPYASTVFPLGLTAPEVQWDNGGTAASAVKIGLIYPAVGTPLFKWEIVIGESTPPRYQIPQAIWQLFERSAKGQDAAITVQRITGGVLRPAVVRPLHFGTAPLRGRIIYTEYRRGGGNTSYIRSLDPGTAAAPANAFPADPPGTLGTRCPVCHSVAANGSVFATSNNIWSGAGGISTINAAGAFTTVGGDYDGATYAVGGNAGGYPDGYRGFGWAPISPDGKVALTGNALWGNSKAGISTWPTATGNQLMITGAANGAGTLNIPSTTISGGNGLGLRGEYHNTATLPAVGAGTPWVRTDPRPYFNFGTTAPGGPVTNANSYSVRWSGDIQPFYSENITFTINTTADVSLVINGTTVIAHNGAVPGALVARTGAIALAAGQRYPITVELIKSAAGTGQIELRWSGAQTVDQTVPQSQLYNSSTNQQNGLLVSYYNNATLTAPTLFQRVEPELASDWGALSPSYSPAFTSADAFSSAWDGRIEAPYTGSYQFRARGEANDAVLVQIDANNDGDFVDAGETVVNQAAGAAFLAGTAWSAGLSLTAGTKYPIHVEHRETGGNALFGVDWQILPPGGGVTAVYCPAAGTGQTSAQLITNNRCANSGNAPVVVTNIQNPTTFPAGTVPGQIATASVANIDTDWGAAGPLGASVGYMARYTFTLYPQVTAYYTFYTTRNDGARLYWPFTVNAMGVPTASPTGAYSFVSGATSNLWADAAANLTAAISTPVLLTAGNTYNMTLLQYYNPASAGPTSAISFLWSTAADFAGTMPLQAMQVIPATNYAPAAILPAEQIPSERLFPPTSYNPTNGLRVTYYNSRDWNNSIPAGATITNQTQGGGAAFTRIEANVDNAWDVRRPQYSRVTADDNFSARYVGTITAPCSGRYVFRLDLSNAGNNDSGSVWIDNNRILNGNYQGTIPLEGVVDMAGSSTHDIKVDYSEADGTGKVQLQWDVPCDVGVNYATVPTAQLSPTGSGGAGGGTRAGGDNASGGNYYVWQLLNAMGNAQVQEITAQSVGRWGLSGTSMMIPSFSPDGTKLVFLNGDSSTGAGWRKGISMFDYDAGMKYFWNRRLIVSNWPSGDVMKWPTFETDSQSIIYQTSTPVETDSNNGNTPYGGVTPSNYFQVPGRLWSTNTAANPPVQVALNNINNGEQTMDQNKSYQPTMLPVAAAGYRWAVFTSTRPYGNRVNTTNNQSYANIASYTAMTDKANHQSMLWVSAIDDTASAATDRSHPPFFLPNQNFAADPTQGYVNERGFWALSPCIPVGTGTASLCNVSEECCGGTGMAPTAICRVDTPITYPSTSHCAAKPAPNACAGEGAACVVNGDCCINDGLVCGGGICKKPPPIDVSAYAPLNFERVYEGTCPVNFSPVWHFFDWQASAPPVGSYIEFYAQTAADPAQFVTLPAAPAPVTDPNVVYLGAAEPGDPTGWVGSDVAIKLSEKGIANQLYLKITMRFAPNTAQDASPVLTNWRQAHSCQPSQ